jgi:uncharacterized membrane protein YiaA
MEFLNPAYLKNRIVREYTEMSNTRKIVYAVLLLASAITVTLLLTGTWDPFAVETGSKNIVKKPTTP